MADMMRLWRQALLRASKRVCQVPERAGTFSRGLFGVGLSWTDEG
jgi:hypothetical protein